MLGLHAKSLCDDIVARHTTFVSSISDEAQMVWLRQTDGDVAPHVTNRFVTHVEDIYHITNHINNTNIQNVALGMTFLNEMMLKAADIYSSVYGAQVTMTDKTIGTPEQNSIEKSAGEPPIVTTVQNLENSIKTVNNINALTSITASDIVKFSQNTINTIKNNANHEHSAIHLDSTELVHIDNSQTQQLENVIVENNKVINKLNTQLQNVTESATTEVKNLTEVSTNSAREEKKAKTSQKTETNTDEVTNVETSDVFTSKMLNVRLKPTENITNIGKTERPSLHYDNRTYPDNRSVTSATVVYDESGRRVRSENREATQTEKIVTETEKIKEVEKVSQGEKKTSEPTTLQPENKVFTSADVTVNSAQTVHETNVSKTDNQYKSTDIVYNKSEGDSTEIVTTNQEVTQNIIKHATRAVEKAQEETKKVAQKQANTQPNRESTTKNIFNSSSLNKSTITQQNVFNASNQQNVLKETKFTEMSRLTEGSVYNLQSHIKRQTLLHNVSNTQNISENADTTNSTVRKGDSNTLSVQNLNVYNMQNNLTAQSFVGENVKNLLNNSSFTLSADMVKNTSVFNFSSTVNGDNTSITHPSATQNLTFDIAQQGDNYTHIETSVTMPQPKMSEATIVFKQENAVTSHDTHDDDDSDEIVTIRKTKKIENTIESESTTNYVMKKQNVVSRGDDMSALASLGTAGINVLAERVYRQLESRLKSERNRRGLK